MSIINLLHVGLSLIYYGGEKGIEELVKPEIKPHLICVLDILEYDNMCTRYTRIQYEKVLRNSTVYGE